MIARKQVTQLAAVAPPPHQRPDSQPLPNDGEYHNNIRNADQQLAGRGRRQAQGHGYRQAPRPPNKPSGRATDNRRAPGITTMAATPAP